MAEPEKDQIGDGQDNFGQAAGKAIQAAKQISHDAAAEAAVKGAEATANAAAAVVQASTESGKAVAEIAAGTAAGGPWGAILSAAWAMRHSLFKVLVCICLFLLIIVILICSIPSIVLDSVFGLNGVPPAEGVTLESSYSEMSNAVSAVIDAGYDQSLARVEEIILDGGYDYDLSMDALINHAQSSAGYDVCYILAAYSASLQQKGTSVEDMVAKLVRISDQMFPVSYVERQQERLVPVSYSTYKPVTVTVVTRIESAGIVNNVPRYNYTTEQRRYHLPDEARESDEEITVPRYKAVSVTVPTYSGSKISGTRTETYYEADGDEALEPTTEIIKYVECTISPFDNSVILEAFGIDTSAQYPQFNLTYGEVIQNMANALKMTLYGTLGSGTSVPLTDAELIAFVNSLSCNDTRKHIVTTALSLVGKVPYFWGGKSEAGFVTISAKTYDELLWRKQQMIDMLKSMDMYLSDCRFQQEDALRSIMPFLQISPKLQKKTQRNVLTSGAASTYMFTSFEMSDDSGVLLGVNRHNNSLCIVDLFNTKINKNANLTMCGTSGAGKTFTLQLLALRMRMRGIQCYIIAPIKGHEFKRACSKIGGEFIKIAPGSPHCINVMEIRHTISPEMELIDEVDYNDMDSMLARKIQQLMIFFSLLIPDMTNEEEQMLDEALIKTYNEFGITHDNNSLYADATCFPPKLKKMPILGDLHKHLLENPMTTRIAAIVSRFVTGSAQSFNRQTNVDLTNKYIVLDLSELKGKLLPVGMMIALDYVWDNIKADRTKKKAIMIDEIWQLIGASSNKLAAEFCLEIFKVIRGYGGAAIAATQDLSDFFSLDDGKYGRAIINNSKNKIILNLEQDEAQYVKDVLKLTRTEVRSITQFERGEALIHSNNNKVPVVIKASAEEKEMITTDRAELEAILRKRQKEAT